MKKNVTIAKQYDDIINNGDIVKELLNFYSQSTSNRINCRVLGCCGLEKKEKVL
jgi:hypothetical protein